jgi:threonine/homoserine/homoserine lactone efflux protein
VIETLAAFALTSLAIELTPGPNMAYLAVLSLERGRRAGLAAVAGVALGLLGLGLVAGLGFGVVIANTRWIYETIRWAGVAFLVYLAWDAFRESRAPLEKAEAGLRLGTYFQRGLITNLLNPKAALFYIAVMPNFIDPTRPQWTQALTLTLIYVAVATAVHAAIALAAAVFQPLLASSRFRRPMGIIAALLLAGIAVWVALATGRAW